MKDDGIEGFSFDEPVGNGMDVICVASSPTSGSLSSPIVVRSKYFEQVSKKTSGNKPLKLVQVSSDLDEPVQGNRNQVPDELRVIFPECAQEQLLAAYLANERNIERTCDYLFQKADSDLPSFRQIIDRGGVVESSSPSAISAVIKQTTRKRGRNMIFSSDSDEDGDYFIPNQHKKKVHPVLDLTASDPVAHEDEVMLSFFNNADVPDLREMCQPISSEQINILLSHRPFKSYQYFLETMEDTRGISERILDNYDENVKLYQQLDSLSLKCQKISDSLSEDLKKWVSSKPDEIADDCGISIIDFSNDKEVSAIQKQSELLNPELHLKNYQLVGVNWLWLLYKKNINGILADSMGLGKTVQVIAFLCHLITDVNGGPFLIVVPASTVGNWQKEFERWAPSISVVVYAGTQAERFDFRTNIGPDEFDVMITTYNMVSSSKDDRIYFRKCKFDYMILDEGHMVKNTSSQRYKHLASIKTPHRLLLTGTPLQNNLQELMALLAFIMPSLFSGSEDALNKLFNMKVDKNSKKWNERMRKAKLIMSPFVLRRKKQDVLKDLPQKIEKVIYCDPTLRQLEMYRSLIAQSRLDYKLSDTSRSGNTVNSSKLNNILMQLRKMSCHPLLHRHCYNDTKIASLSRELTREEPYWDSDVNSIYEDLSFMSDFQIHSLCAGFKKLSTKYGLQRSMIEDSGKVSYLLKTLLPRIREKKGKVLIFSQFTLMLDVLEEVLSGADFSYRRMDGSTPVADRQALIDEYQNDDSIFAFLLSTKAGGFGINLTAANYVVLYDLDFNPHNDAQAEDRAHRGKKILFRLWLLIDASNFSFTLSWPGKRC